MNIFTLRKKIPLLFLGITMVIATGACNSVEPRLKNTPPVAAAVDTPEPVPTQPIAVEILFGTVRDVSPSARIIWLQEETDEFTTVALTADCTITTASGQPLELAQIQPGLTIEASGQPGENQTLVAYAVQVVPSVKPNATPPDPQGYLIFPYQSADAGNFFLQAGDAILVTWEQAPPGAESYAFILTSSADGASQTLGVDEDGLNGVTTMMNVPAHLNGQLVGRAQFENGAQIWSASSTVYSGEYPPAQVCSLQATGVGVTQIYREPAADSSRFAYLTPGTYATVIKKVNADWYLVDASVALDATDNTAAQGEGWVNAGNSSVSLHGSCDDIPNGEWPPQQQETGRKIRCLLEN